MEINSLYMYAQYCVINSMNKTRYVALCVTTCIILLLFWSRTLLIHQVNVDVCISTIQTNPAAVNHFEEQKIIAVAAGDEFSLALDARWHPWGWGRAEHGQVCVNI